MENYGRQQQVRVPPTTPSTQRQRFPSQDTLPYPDYYRNRTPQSSTRFSLPSPGSRPSPQSLPPQHTRRQSAALAPQPHYVTPTRPRHSQASNVHQGRTVQVDPEQWENLRSRGYVLKGSGEQQRTSVSFAPSLAVIPSQISSSASSSYASTNSSGSPQRRIKAPAFQVHPSLRTGFHPGAEPVHNGPPHNQFMKRPLEAAHPHRQPVYGPSSASSRQSSIRYDPVDAALVIRQAPPAQQAITFHASSFTPDPIYRAHYLAQPNTVRQPPPQEWSRQPQQYTYQQPARPQYEQHPLQQQHPSHQQQQQQQQQRHPSQSQQHQQHYQQQRHQSQSQSQSQKPPSRPPIHAIIDQPSSSSQASAHPLSPTYQIFSRPSSPDSSVLAAPVPNGCFRSSTLRRQETEQSAYSQATLPEPYLPSLQLLHDQQQQQQHQPSPLVLSDWQPLSVDPVRTRSQDIRSLWLDLEKALMDSPSLPSSSRPATPVTPRREEGSDREYDETTYDFTNLDDAKSGGAGEEEEECAMPKTSLTRPRLVRRDKSEDHLEAGRRALASSIIEKAQSIAAALNAPPLTTSKPPERVFPPVNTAQDEKTAGKHVRISTEEEIIDAAIPDKPKVPARPSKIPKRANASVKHSSRIPVPTKRSRPSANAASKAVSKHVAWEEPG